MQRKTLTKHCSGNRKDSVSSARGRRGLEEEYISAEEATLNEKEGVVKKKGEEEVEPKRRKAGTGRKKHGIRKKG